MVPVLIFLRFKAELLRIMLVRVPQTPGRSVFLKDAQFLFFARSRFEFTPYVGR